MTFRSPALLALAVVLLAGAASDPARAAPAPAEAPAMTSARLAGRYDGGQTETAAQLELGTDGRFHYGLAYGALDEEARGRWEFDGSQVLLTSDPVAAPRFVLVDARPSDSGDLKLTLDLPQGMDRQYFNARVMLADGRTIERQFAEDGLDAPLGPGDEVVSVALMLSVYEVESEPLPLPHAHGGEAHIRFEPHDLGKVAFARQPLRITPGGLVLERYDRTLVFRRVTGE